MLLIAYVFIYKMTPIANTISGFALLLRHVANQFHLKTPPNIIFMLIGFA